METISFPGVNVYIGRGQAAYKEIPAYSWQDENGTFTFCYQLSPEELKEVNESGGKLWLSQFTFGANFQPIRCEAYSPFVARTDMGYNLVVMGHRVEGEDEGYFPHLGNLVRSNPQATSLYTCVNEGSSDPERRKYLWRNADGNIRRWWRAMRNEAKGDRFVFIEYDVVVNMDLTSIAHTAGDFCGKRVMTQADHLEPNGKPWHFFCQEELGRLDMFAPVGNMEPVGMVPLAFIVLSRKALDIIVDDYWEHMFSNDVFCELRLASILNHMGCALTSLNLPGVDWKERDDHPGEFPGIWHAVKGDKAPKAKEVKIEGAGQVWDVTECSACGGNHAALKFMRLESEDTTDTEAYMTLCPVEGRSVYAYRSKTAGL